MYGDTFDQFVNNATTFDISLCEAPCRSPCCCLASVACFCPAQVHLRYKVLNHVEPNSGWENYSCCQGHFRDRCCIQPGQIGESTCPLPCMCLEAFLCPALAVYVSANVIREEHNLGWDDMDIRVFRCYKRLKEVCCALSLCLMFLNGLDGADGNDGGERIVEWIPDFVFCCLSTCMTAQVYHEIHIRESLQPPPPQQMDR